MTSQKQINLDLDEIAPWFNQGGIKMFAKEPSKDSVRIANKTGTATISIKKICDPDLEGGFLWQLEWEIIFRSRFDGKSEGTAFFTEKELLDSFGLARCGSKKQDIKLQGFRDISGGKDIEVENKFFRSGRLLCIPHKGTGIRNEPNLSIYLSMEIRAQILKLLKADKKTRKKI